MNHVLTKLEFGGTTAKRAQYEAFEFAFAEPGSVRVTNGSYGDEAADHTYRVTVENGVPVACECPSDEYRTEACKHRVAVAIRAPVLAACDDGRHDVAADGGQVLEESGDGRPDDCLCPAPRETILHPTDSDVLDETPNDLPCFPCVRDGFEAPNPDATEGDR